MLRYWFDQLDARFGSKLGGKQVAPPTRKRIYVWYVAYSVFLVAVGIVGGLVPTSVPAGLTAVFFMLVGGWLSLPFALRMARRDE